MKVTLQQWHLCSEKNIYRTNSWYETQKITLEIVIRWKALQKCFKIKPPYQRKNRHGLVGYRLSWRALQISVKAFCQITMFVFCSIFFIVQ